MDFFKRATANKQNPGLEKFGANVREALAREPIDTDELGRLAFEALSRGRRGNFSDTYHDEYAPNMWSMRAYEDLYWQMEERLLEEVPGRQPVDNRGNS